MNSLKAAISIRHISPLVLINRIGHSLPFIIKKTVLDSSSKTLYNKSVISLPNSLYPSIFKTDTKLTENDKIIVLQTCLFGKYKGKLMLVIGKRVDNE